MNEYKRPPTRQEYLDDIKAKVESKEYGTKISDKIKSLERELNRVKTYTKEDWENFQKEFKEKFGFNVSIFNVFDYISLDNKKHNDAIELLKQAAKLFEVI
jgi:trans-2-enoyl-CoA reductase